MLANAVAAPPVFETSQRHFGADRVERMYSLAISVIALVFGGQALAFAIAAEPLFSDLPRTINVVVVILSLTAVIALGATPRAQRIANIVFAVSYLAALVAWPIITQGSFAVLETESWLWYLNSVACAAAAQALKPVLAVPYIVLVAFGYGVVRTIGPNGVIYNERIGFFDASYALIIGLVIFSLGVAMRNAARRVDEARIAALAAYNEAARQHANQSERHEVDAIVHDTVLAALQAADRAHTPEQSRAAVAMASEAITRLATLDVSAQPDLVMTTQRVLTSIEHFAESLDVDFVVRREGSLERELPWAVGESLYLAAGQAMTNSAQHAGARPGQRDLVDIDRRVTLDIRDPRAVVVTISDDGVGFDREAVDPSRLGLRVSIIERATAVGANVSVTTQPGEGTTIVISWQPEGIR